jgi:hypothetical protein
VTPAILVCVDGLASYVTAFLQVFRQPVYTGRRGRPRLVLSDGFQFAQVVKHAAKRRVVGVTQRVVRGTLAGIEAVLTATATGTVINTAYIERLNATFRAHLAPLTRRGRAIARTEAALTAGMWLVGTAYNFCWPHDSLRQLAPDRAPRKWLQRTPAMAAGLTDHCWTLDELLRFQIPLPRWVPPSDADVRPNVRPWEWPHDHGSVGCYLSVQMLEDQFPEIAVIRDEDSLLSNGDRQDFVIWKAGRVVLADSSCVVADAVQKNADPGLGALVEQESHRWT